MSTTKPPSDKAAKKKTTEAKPARQPKRSPSRRTTMKSRSKNPTAGDKLRAWANNRLNRLVPLDRWVAAAPRTALDMEIRNRVVEELHRLTQIDDIEAEIITGRRAITVITKTKATPSKKRASRSDGGSTEANSE